MDTNITFRLYVPIGMMLLLAVMLYFHRYSALKYLYFVNILFLLVVVIFYFVWPTPPVGTVLSGLLMEAMPYIFLISIVGGYALSIISALVFVRECAQSQQWAKILIQISGLALIPLGIWWGYLFIKGVLSLKSG